MKVALSRPVALATAAISLTALAATMQAPSAHAAGPTLVMTARADLYQGVGAQAKLRVNGKDVTQWMVNNTGSFVDFSVTLPDSVNPGDKIDVFFANDDYDSGQDRNLEIQKIRVGSTTLSANSATYDRGADWSAATDGESLADPWKMFWAGAMRFQMAGSSVVSDPTSLTSSSAASSAARPFASDSFWYQQIPSNAPLNGNSWRYANTLSSDVKQYWSAVNTTSYAPPIYVADANTPRHAIKNTYCNGGGSDAEWMTRNWDAQFGSVPIPAAAKGSAGEDSEVVIWSPSTDEVWELWRFDSGSGGYSACWGGKIASASKSDGVFPYPFGVAASGLSLLGGTVRVSELQSGEINHAVAIGINRPRGGTYSWPANRTDGTWWSDDAIPEGTRLRLDPSLNVDSLNLDPVVKTIAKAAQRYGFIVRDNSGGPVVIYAEDASPYIRATGRNPYDGLSSQEQHKWMHNFPWDRVQAMPLNYGKP